MTNVKSKNCKTMEKNFNLLIVRYFFCVENENKKMFVIFPMDELLDGNLYEI